MTSVLPRFDVISLAAQKRAAVLGVAAAFLLALRRAKVYDTALFKRLVASWPPSVQTLSKYGPAVIAVFLVPIVHRVVKSFKPLEVNEAQLQWKTDEMQKRRAVLRNLLMLAFKLAKRQSRDKMAALLGRIDGGSELRAIQAKIKIETGEEEDNQDVDRHEQQWEKRLEAEVQFKDVKNAVGDLQEGLTAGGREPLVTAGYVVAAVLLANDLEFTIRETTLALNAKKSGDGGNGGEGGDSLRAGSGDSNGDGSSGGSGGGSSGVSTYGGEEANEKYRDGRELENLVKRTERMDEFLRSSSFDLFAVVSSSVGVSGDFSPEDQRTIRCARAEYWSPWCKADKLVESMAWHKYSKAASLLLQAKQQLPFIMGASMFSVLMGVLRSTHLYYESILIKTVKDQSMGLAKAGAPKFVEVRTLGYRRRQCRM
jgi:hypothetical protein